MAQLPQIKKQKSVEYTWKYDEFKYPDQKLKAVKSIQQFRARFSCGALLGCGGDGDVYSVRDKPWAAIKKIILDEEDDEEYELIRAQQEQRLLSKASIANIYGIYYEETKYKKYIYKVYDRYNYGLDDIISAMKDVRPTEQQIKHVISDICRDLKHLHHQGFMHLDIKASNILYCKRGTYRKHWKDAGSFKLIDYDGCIWNRTVDDDGNEHFDQGVELPWQGTFCWTAPEMNDYVEETNLISYAADIWQIGLVILYMIHKGHLGLMDIAEDDNNRFYQQYDTLDEVAIKGELFDEWYDAKFGKDKLYELEVERLYERKRISKELYELLSNGIFIRDPLERYSIEEVLEHPWFDNVDKEYLNVDIEDEVWDYYDALMYKDDVGNKVYNGRIRWIQRQQIPSDDEGSNDDNSEDEDDDDTEYEDENKEEEEDQQEENVKNDDKKIDEESPEIRFYSDKDSEEEPTVSRYYSSDFAHNTHSGSSASETDDNGASKIIARFSATKPIIRKVVRRMSV